MVISQRLIKEQQKEQQIELAQVHKMDEVENRRSIPYQV